MAAKVTNIIDVMVRLLVDVLCQCRDVHYYDTKANHEVSVSEEYAQGQCWVLSL